jgi:glutathione S-transferase
MKIWSDFITSRFIPSFHRFLQQQPSSSGGSDEALKDARSNFLGLIKEFTAEMETAGPYFMGSTPMMVDFLIAPWAVRLWVFDHYKGGLGIPDEGQGGADEESWSRWRKFVAAISARASVKATTSQQQHYLPIYQRYADDKAQSELAKATRSGRGVP